MSLAPDIAAMKRELSALKTATCEIRLASANWVANPSNRVACHYEATPPATGGELDYEAGNGYGYTVWFDSGAVTINAKDTVVIIASPINRDVGMELQVLRIPARGSAGPVDKVETVKR